jgi:hypothetical protein
MNLTQQQAGIAMDREMITRQIELLISQLDRIKYTKQPNLASRIAGGIEQLLLVRDGQSGGGSGDVNNRVQRAVDLVMRDKPDAPGLTGDLHPALADPPYHETEKQPSKVEQLYPVNGVPSRE